MKYKQYVVTKTSLGHVFIYEDDQYYESNDLGEVAQKAFEQMEWDTIDSSIEYVGEFSEE